jgi:hypothetical protein
MVDNMRRAFFIFMLLAVVAACGCVVNTDYGAPTPEPVPTAEPLPTLPPAPTITPVPASSSDPIIGTWEWIGANNTLVVYSFHADGTFDRHDTDMGTAYSGVWERKGPETYELIYNTPIPGIAKETVTYYPSASRLERNQTFYTRV